MLRVRKSRRRLSMTSLIDVIFLLLLFFMLSSTFSKFAEVELGAGAGGAMEAGVAPVFVQLFPDRLTVDGRTGTLETLTIETQGEGRVPVIVSLQPGVSAQRLTDLLVAMRRFEGVSVAVLGAG